MDIMGQFIMPFENLEGEDHGYDQVTYEKIREEMIRYLDETSITRSLPIEIQLKLMGWS
jgi:hypothetical protein